MKLTEEQAHFRKECVAKTAQALTDLYEFDGLIMLGHDEDSHETLVAVGLEPRQIIELLQQAINSVCREHGIPTPRRLTLPKGLDTSGFRLAGRCPQCHAEVHGPPTVPAEGLDHCAAVCDCGSFLVPQYDGAGQLCGVALMTLDQVGALPDHVRSTLTRLRRDGYSTGRRVAADE